MDLFIIIFFIVVGRNLHLSITSAYQGVDIRHFFYRKKDAPQGASASESGSSIYSSLPSTLSDEGYEDGQDMREPSKQMKESHPQKDPSQFILQATKKGNFLILIICFTSYHK